MLYVTFRGVSGTEYEHVRIAEKALGKKLPAGAVIHHRDENRRNNDPGNLVICEDHGYHMLLHRRVRVYHAGGRPGRDKICSRCRSVKPLEKFSPDPGRPEGRYGYCRQCRRRTVVAQEPAL